MSESVYEWIRVTFSRKDSVSTGQVGTVRMQTQKTEPCQRCVTGGQSTVSPVGPLCAALMLTQDNEKTTLPHPVSHTHTHTGRCTHHTCPVTHMHTRVHTPPPHTCTHIHTHTPLFGTRNLHPPNDFTLSSRGSALLLLGSPGARASESNIHKHPIHTSRGGCGLGWGEEVVEEKRRPMGK